LFYSSRIGISGKQTAHQPISKTSLYSQTFFLFPHQATHSTSQKHPCPQSLLNESSIYWKPRVHIDFLLKPRSDKYCYGNPPRSDYQRLSTTLHISLLVLGRWKSTSQTSPANRAPSPPSILYQNSLEDRILQPSAPFQPIVFLLGATK
jgi:hypothetical protein